MRLQFIDINTVYFRIGKTLIPYFSNFILTNHIPNQLLLKINGTLDPLKHPHDHPLQYGVYFLPPTSPRWEQKLVEQGLL